MHCWCFAKEGQETADKTELEWDICKRKKRGDIKKQEQVLIFILLLLFIKQWIR